MKPSRMFSFITRTWNPLGGECRHKCDYNCWAQLVSKRFMHKKYAGEPRIIESQMRDLTSHKFAFDSGDFIFVCDMCDLFGDWVPHGLIDRIVQHASHSDALFLFLTKNPRRYKEFVFGLNCWLGATIETDYDALRLGCAPPRLSRLKEMQLLNFPNKMVAVEPIMAFSPNFVRELVAIKPNFMAVGYDNYNSQLPEPALATTEALIVALEAVGIKVYRKTMRERAEVLP